MQDQSIEDPENYSIRILNEKDETIAIFPMINTDSIEALPDGRLQFTYNGFKIKGHKGVYERINRLVQ